MVARRRGNSEPNDDDNAAAMVAETVGAEEIEVPEIDPKYRREQVAAYVEANLPAVTTRMMSVSELHDIASMDDAVAYFRQVTGEDVVEAREEIGDGFDYLDNKDLLVGRPLLFLQWENRFSATFTDKDGQPLRVIQAWVVVSVKDGIRKVRISDFSTGICQQLWEYTERKGRAGGLAAPKGLRKSEFPYVDPDTGARSVAATYYIDLSKDL